MGSHDLVVKKRLALQGKFCFPDVISRVFRAPRLLLQVAGGETDEVIMLSCKEVCAHAVQASERQVRWQEHLQIFFHLMMCGNCRKAVGQIRLMLVTSRRRGDKEPTPEQVERWLAAIERRKAGRGPEES